MTDRLDEGVKYPGQPLDAVVVAAVFPSRFSVLNLLGEVQARFEDEFPRVFVPKVQEGDALAFRPYQFRTDDDAQMLGVGLNQVSYLSRDYPGFSAFLERTMSTIPPVLEILDVSDLVSVRFRYENVINMAGGTLEDFVASPLPGWCGDGSVVDVDLDWHVSHTGGSIGGEMYVVDDGNLIVSIVATEIKRDEDKFETLVRRAHDVAASCFERMITPGYRALISTRQVP